MVGSYIACWAWLLLAMGSRVRGADTPAQQTQKVWPGRAGFSDSEWAALVRRVQPKLDFVPPKGTVEQPKNAGQFPILTPQIIGGAEVAKCDLFPHMVAVDDGDNAICGGSILSPSWILTAAHCTSDPNVRVSMAGLTHKVETPENGRMMFSTNEYYIHPKYDSNLKINDISIIKLKSKIPMGKNDYPCIRAIRLPKSSDASKNFEGTITTISGWGITQDGNTSPNLVLKSTSNKVITNEKCLESLEISSGNICTEPLPDTDGSTDCTHDSGGPLVYKEADGLYTQLGVVSFGPKPCKGGYSAYVRVTNYLGWISKTTKLSIRTK